MGKRKFLDIDICAIFILINDHASVRRMVIKLFFK